MNDPNDLNPFPLTFILYPSHLLSFPACRPAHAIALSRFPAL
jgi:hypothetical protein